MDTGTYPAGGLCFFSKRQTQGPVSDTLPMLFSRHGHTTSVEQGWRQEEDSERCIDALKDMKKRGTVPVDTSGVRAKTSRGWGRAPSPETSFSWRLTLPNATSFDPTSPSPPPLVAAAFPRRMRLPRPLSTSTVESCTKIPPPRDALLPAMVCSP